MSESDNRTSYTILNPRSTEVLQNLQNSGASEGSVSLIFASFDTNLKDAETRNRRGVIDTLRQVDLLKQNREKSAWNSLHFLFPPREVILSGKICLLRVP